MVQESGLLGLGIIYTDISIVYAGYVIVYTSYLLPGMLKPTVSNI